MPRFFFDVTDQMGLTRDGDGQELASLEAAREVAIQGIRSMLQEDLLSGLIDLSGRIDILGADQRLLATVPYGDAVTVHGLPPR